jgi:hypothetical protein
LRTPAWFLRCGVPGLISASTERQCVHERDGATAECELFVKPDDRWDFNEVSSRCPDIVSEMREELERFATAAQASQLDELPPLPELLAERLD